ncbi:hypothetical protein ACWDYJ_03230 [Streptomyces sp. NPDC003042]
MADPPGQSGHPFERVEQRAHRVGQVVGQGRQEADDEEPAQSAPQPLGAGEPGRRTRGGRRAYGHKRAGISSAIGP